MKKVRKVVAILREHGFQLERQKGTSHRQYEGFVDGKRRTVTISQADGEDIAKKLLGHVIRQSGLPRKLFR